ncbi:hypothetical protein D3C75_1190990 [compost metagenome]
MRRSDFGFGNPNGKRKRGISRDQLLLDAPEAAGPDLLLHGGKRDDHLDCRNSDAVRGSCG